MSSLLDEMRDGEWYDSKMKRPVVTKEGFVDPVVVKINEFDQRELAVVLLFMWWAIKWIMLPMLLGVIIAVLLDGGYTFFVTLFTIISLFVYFVFVFRKKFKR